MILIWRFSDRVKIAKLTYAIIDPFIPEAWVSLHTVLKIVNLKSRQQRFLSRPPNITFANNSAYTIYYDPFAHKDVCFLLHFITSLFTALTAFIPYSSFYHLVTVHLCKMNKVGLLL